MSTMTKSTVTDKYGDEHAIPGPYTTLESIKRANVAAGNHFFDADTLRFFRSRIAPGVIAGRLFITSEQFEDSTGERHERRYTVRVATDHGTIEDVSEFQQFATLAAARRYAESLVR